MTQLDTTPSDADVAGLLKQLLANGGKPKRNTTEVHCRTFDRPLPAGVEHRVVTLSGPRACVTWRTADTEGGTLDVYALVAGANYVPADLLEDGVLPESLSEHFADIEVSALQTKPPKSPAPSPVLRVRNVGGDALKFGPHVLVPGPRCKLILNCEQLRSVLATVHSALRYGQIAVELATEADIAAASAPRAKGAAPNTSTDFASDPLRRG